MRNWQKIIQNFQKKKKTILRQKLKLFYVPTEQQYYIYYFKGYSFIIYKVENISPLNILVADYIGVPNTNDREIIKVVEEFAKEEFKKLDNGY